MAIDITVWDRQVTAIIDANPAFKKTMVWVNPSGTTESISVAINPIQKRGELVMEGSYPDYAFSALAALSSFANSSVLPNPTTDDVTIGGVQYFVQSRSVDGASVNMVLSLR